MPPEETWTVNKLLTWTRGFFEKKGIEKPRLEAEILLAHALGKKRIDLYAAFNDEPAEPQRAIYRDLVKRRGSGEPVAYLTGFREFYSLDFKVNRSVLIPRPETEDLVLKTLDKLAEYPKGAEPVIADIGTGSGAIAVTIAKHLPKNLSAVKLIAADIAPEALTIAKENAERHGVAAKIDFRHSDLLDGIPEPLDIIVSNPPYVSQQEYEALPPDVKNYEPKGALLAGETGTEVTQRLIEQAVRQLQSGGHLLIEGSPMTAARVKALFKPSGWDDLQVFADFAGLQRIIYGRKS